MGKKFKESIISKITDGNNLLTYILKGEHILIEQLKNI